MLRLLQRKSDVMTSDFKSSKGTFIEKLKKNEKTGRFIGSKWSKTNVLLENKQLSEFVPKTLKLDPGILKSMLNEFKMVYLKPVNGTYGKGVMRAEKHGEGEPQAFHYQMGTERKNFISFPSFYRSIMHNKMKRKYIVQQGINLLTYNKRLFDLRIMVQKNPQGAWESTGIIGRVAQPNKIVTNYHNGGIPMAIETIFKPYMTDEYFAEYHKILKKLGRYIAVVLNKRYPMLNMLGIDVGVDRNLYPWIIEVNTNPDVYIFKKLKDKEIFRKVYRYAKRLDRT